MGGNGVEANVDEVSHYCPYSALAKFPYKYLKGDAQHQVSQAFFAGGKFKQRSMSCYYLYRLPSQDKLPLVLVSWDDVLALLEEISSKLHIYVSKDRLAGIQGFRISFSNTDRLKPVLAGSSLETGVLKGGEELSKPDTALIDAFLALPEGEQKNYLAKVKAAGVSQQKRGEDPERKRAQRVDDKRCQLQALERAAVYLDLPEDLNPPGETSRGDVDIDNSGPKDLADLRDSSPILIAIDVEWYELNQGKMTEVGICTLDTMDLIAQRQKLGSGNIDLYKAIRGRHLRIVENAHLRNGRFVHDFADQFEKKFGTSEWISLHDLPQALATCFREPYSHPEMVKYFPRTPQEVINRHSSYIDAFLPSSNLPFSGPRPIVLIGHSVQGDIDMIRNAGYHIHNLARLVEILDTAKLFRAWKRESNIRSLAAVLADFKIDAWALHNAGNDAAYTMLAFVNIIKQSRISASTSTTTTTDPETKDTAEPKPDAEEWKEASNS